ncbi:hypothetical protein [Deinococcus sp. Leaf326]|uniref:hypothetical protein n=1 Tax=Deinococcus sp. Leaf326 TaxID=1736338 RepID=UPI000A868200|nr:hypothetical protein [Deinococcus sp. Leaf326]
MKGHPESLGVTRLEGGEVSRPVRVRAPEWVHERLKTLSAGEVGELLAQAFSGQPVAPTAAPSASATAPVLEGVTVLRVLAPTVPQALRNKLRWSPDRYAQLEATLAAGDHLRLDVTNGKAIWRTLSGEAVRRDTVERLLGVGVLALEH